MTEREKVGLKFRLIYQELQKIQDAIIRMDVMLGNIESVSLSSIPEENLSREEKELLEDIPDELPEVKKPKQRDDKGNRDTFTVKNAIFSLQSENPGEEILLSDLLDKVLISDDPKENQNKIYVIVDELIKKGIVEEAGIGKIKIVE